MEWLTEYFSARVMIVSLFEARWNVVDIVVTLHRARGDQWERILSCGAISRWR